MKQATSNSSIDAKKPPLYSNSNININGIGGSSKTSINNNNEKKEENISSSKDTVDKPERPTFNPPNRSVSRERLSISNSMMLVPDNVKPGSSEPASLPSVSQDLSKSNESMSSRKKKPQLSVVTRVKLKDPDQEKSIRKPMATTLISPFGDDSFITIEKEEQGIALPLIYSPKKRENQPSGKGVSPSSPDPQASLPLPGAVLDTREFPSEEMFNDPDVSRKQLHTSFFVQSYGPAFQQVYPAKTEHESDDMESDEEHHNHHQQQQQQEQQQRFKQDKKTRKAEKYRKEAMDEILGKDVVKLANNRLGSVKKYDAFLRMVSSFSTSLLAGITLALSVGFYQISRNVTDAKAITSILSSYKSMGYPIHKLKFFLFLLMLPYYFQALLWDRQTPGILTVIVDTIKGERSVSTLIYRFFRLLYLASPIAAYVIHCLNIMTEYSIYSAPAGSILKIDSVALARWTLLQEIINWLILLTFFLHAFFAFNSVNRGRPSNVIKISSK